MRNRLALALVVGGMFQTAIGQALSAESCPVTIGVAELFSAPFPSAPPRRRWYGSERLAVQLPADGIWPTTKPGNLIAIKLFWWSDSYKPGTERNLGVTVEQFFKVQKAAVPIIGKPTTAHAKDLGGWTMLTGIDIPEKGCWKISASYLGQTLDFVVETVEYSEWKRTSTE